MKTSSNFWLQKSCLKSNGAEGEICILNSNSGGVNDGCHVYRLEDLKLHYEEKMQTSGHHHMARRPEKPGESTSRGLNHSSSGTKQDPDVIKRYNTNHTPVDEKFEVVHVASHSTASSHRNTASRTMTLAKRANMTSLRRQ